MVGLWTLTATSVLMVLKVRAEPPPAPRGGALYPQDSETREVRKLDGVWNFRVSPPDPETGFKEFWFKYDLAKVRTRLCRQKISIQNVDMCANIDTISTQRFCVQSCRFCPIEFARINLSHVKSQINTNTTI